MIHFISPTQLLSYLSPFLFLLHGDILPFSSAVELRLYPLTYVICCTITVIHSLSKVYGFMKCDTPNPIDYNIYPNILINSIHIQNTQGEKKNSWSFLTNINVAVSSPYLLSTLSFWTMLSLLKLHWLFTTSCISVEMFTSLHITFPNLSLTTILRHKQTLSSYYSHYHSQSQNIDTITLHPKASAAHA